MAANLVFGFHASVNQRDEFGLQNGNEARGVFGIVVVVYGQCLVTWPSDNGNNQVFIKRKILSGETSLSTCTHTHMHTHAHTRALVLSLARTHAHTHTHTLSLSLSHIIILTNRSSFMPLQVNAPRFRK